VPPPLSHACAAHVLAAGWSSEIKAGACGCRCMLECCGNKSNDLSYRRQLGILTRLLQR
jgi:hypothetical protein